MVATFKQLEAFYWTATLGSVTEAAQHLNLAQSTISKRLSELEASVGRSFFARSGHNLALTEAGAASLPVAAKMLALEPLFREAATGSAAHSGSFRFGVTELVALTWLPKLVVALKQEFPMLVPIPEVAASIDLFSKLEARQLDLAIGLDPPRAVTAVPLAEVQLEWVAAPNFGPDQDRIPLREMARYPILSQTQGSGLQRLVVDWAAANGLEANRVVECNSLNVLASLAAAGLGVTFLTAAYFAPEIERGHLRIIKTDPPIPPLRYYAAHRSDDVSPLPARIAEIARQTCDFEARSLPLSDAAAA